MEAYFDESGDMHQKPDAVIPTRRLSAYALVRSEEGKILMIQPTWNTLWELPGGGIEPDEAIKDGVIRECLEETGYAVSLEDQPLHVGERNFFSKAYNTYFKALLLMYPGRIAAPPSSDWKMNAVEKNEISKIEWVELSTLTDNNTHPIFWPAVKLIKDPT